MGVTWSAIQENFLLGDTKYNAKDIPDMSGKVILVTGGTAGIGKETARNAKVWITARDKSKGETTLREPKTSTGKDAHLLLMVLANLKSIKVAAEELLSKETQLNVLFNNAGVMIPPIDQLTDDGYDLQFGTNVLGHFYFTKLVLPVLLSISKSAPDVVARVVNTSSNAHWFSGLKFDTRRDGPIRRKESACSLYGQSKALKRRYGDQGIVSTSLNPGGIKTELRRHGRYLFKAILNLVLHDVSYCAITQLYAGIVPHGASLNGKADLWTWLKDQVANVRPPHAISLNGLCFVSS
ncbi:NAD(P)-binding protein [Gyrodon lividus]|nr:NAD(P)-binding protein [Gyrodon lividus]